MENFDFDLNFDDDLPIQKQKILKTDEPQPNHRRTTLCTTFSEKYEHRRAFSETHLIDCLGLDDFKPNHVYNFLTAGDVDALSYLKLMLRHNDTINSLIVATWVLSAEDILQFDKWIEGGRIKHLDLYLGEIFHKTYKIEFDMIKQLFDKYKCGRVAIFRNHSKIFAGETDKYKFGIQMSCNINTNPRCENGCIQINNDIYDFYKEYFDDINSFKFD